MPGFDEDSARRIADVVRRVEQMPVNTIPAPVGPRTLQPIRFFILTTQLTAFDGTTAGYGKGTMQIFDPTTKRFMATTHTNIDIYSIIDVPIIVGSLIQCVVADGSFFYDVTACGNGESN